MSYCRFQNTLQDLNECVNEMDEPTQELSREEARAKMELIELCKTIVENEAEYESLYAQHLKENAVEEE